MIESLESSEKWQKFFNVRVKSPYSQDIEDKICKMFLITGNTNPYYKYFLTKPDETKDNLIMLFEEIRKQRFFIASGVFIGYNVTKSVLWRYGYFAHFFYHTRFMSLIFYLISINLITQSFKHNLQQNDLLRYYSKRIKGRDLENAVRKDELRSLMINEKFNEINNRLI